MIRDRKLFEVGQIVTSEMSLDRLFEVIIEQTNRILGTERATVFLHDKESEELWSLVATGMVRDEIRIPSNHGIAGWVFHNRAPLIINDAYDDYRFYAEIDRTSTFRTRNILCVPLISRKGECIGVLQALNKAAGEFMDDDLVSLTSISHYVTIALENSQLYQEVKEYSEELRKTLERLEELERVKRQLTKFVPTSVASLVEEDPISLALEKRPQDVTVLFIDIQGFSEITEKFDQSLVNHMVENHFSKYLDCIQRRGGEVNETSGDGLMVLFKEGPPQATAQEAVLAGLEIVDRNRILNDELSYPWGRVELHLGINTGSALVGSTKMKSLTGERWTYTASGMVTVLAARIGAFSERTRLYIGEETYSLLNDRFQCEFQGVHKAKNVKKPIPIYWAKSCSDVEGLP